MADGTNTTETTSTVTVMSAEQMTQLVTAIVSAINGFKESMVVRLSNMESNITRIHEEIGSLKETVRGFVNGNDAFSLTSRLETLNSHADTIASELGGVNTKLEELKSGHEMDAAIVAAHISNVSDKLEVDITPDNLDLEYASKTGVKSIAYIVASDHVSRLKRIVEAEEEASTDEEGGSDDDDASADNGASDVDTAIRETAEEVFGDLTGYDFGVTDGERITFKTPGDFEESRVGLPFDYTRMFYTNIVDVVDNTEVNEYAILLFDSLVKTSEKSGENEVQRMKNWIDRKIIQTVVLVTNTLSGSCMVYFPTQDSYDALDTETYKTEKDATDAIVKKYQEIIEDQYKGISFIPVKDIGPGITLEEYRMAAKNITPTCEYT